MKERLGLTPQLLPVSTRGSRIESTDVPGPSKSPLIPEQDRVGGRTRFAGDKLQGVREQPLEVTFGRKSDLNNPQMGLIRERSSIQSRQNPGGTFESTQTEKMFE